MKKKQTKKLCKAFKWSIEYAAACRGCLIGNPDPRPLAEFDYHLQEARNEYKKLKKLL